MSIDHRSLPRKKRTPSARDQAIYVARHARGWSQAELAKEHRLSQSRVSQILRRVEKWRAGVRPEEAGELDQSERQRVERWLERERHQEIYDRSLAAYDRGPKQLATTKEGERGENKFHETTTRELAPNVQLLKVAQRSAEALAKAADKPAPPRQPDPAAQRDREERQMLQVLMRMRQEAEAAGKVPKSVPHQGDNFDYIRIVETWLAALLGEEQQPVNAVHFQPGKPLVKLVGAIADLGLRIGDFSNGVSGSHIPNSKSPIPNAPASNATNAAASEQPQTHSPPEVAAESSPKKFKVPQSDRDLYRQLADDPTNLPPIREAAERRLREWEAADSRSLLPEGTSEEAQRPAASAKIAPPNVPTRCPGPARQAGPTEGTSEEAQRPADPTSCVAPPNAFTRCPGPARQAGPTDAERRRLHQEKLRQWELARRRGLPCMFHFDPADGPLPPRTVQLDGAPG